MVEWFERKKKKIIGIKQLIELKSLIFVSVSEKCWKSLSEHFKITYGFFTGMKKNYWQFEQKLCLCRTKTMLSSHLWKKNMPSWIKNYFSFEKKLHLLGSKLLCQTVFLKSICHLWLKYTIFCSYRNKNISTCRKEYATYEKKTMVRLKKKLLLVSNSSTVLTLLVLHNFLLMNFGAIIKV